MNSKILWDLVDQNKNICIFFKNNASADHLGAAIALKNILEKNNKNVQIVGEKGNKLKEFDVEEKFNKWWKGDENEQDLAIILGSPEKLKTSRFEQLNKFKTKLILLNFKAEKWGDINIYLDNPSLCEVLFDFFREKNIEIDSETATYLLLGIYNNSSTFLSESTSHKTFKRATELMELNPNMKKISNTFRNLSYVHEKLSGDIISKSQIRANKILILNITIKQVYEHMPYMFGKLTESKNQSEIVKITGKFFRLNGIKIIVSIFYDIFNPKNVHNKYIIVDCFNQEDAEKLKEIGFTQEFEHVFLKNKLVKYCSVDQARSLINEIIKTFE